MIQSVAAKYDSKTALGPVGTPNTTPKAVASAAVLSLPGSGEVTLAQITFANTITQIVLVDRNALCSSSLMPEAEADRTKSVLRDRYRAVPV